MRPLALSFSKYAHSYDEYATLQQVVFQRLEAELEKKAIAPRHILDIGCGTGTHTISFLKRYPNATITGIDLAPSMIEYAKESYGHLAVDFEIGDARGLPESGVYDLIVSNATLQWVPDLKKVLAHIQTKLAPEGTCVLTLFGPQTFWELQQCLATVLGRPHMVAASAFNSASQIHQVASEIFPDIRFKQELIKKRYLSLLDLLKHIKFTGSNPVFPNTRMWTPGLIQEIETLYLASYRAIQATYQVFYLTK